MQHVLGRAGLEVAAACTPRPGSIPAAPLHLCPAAGRQHPLARPAQSNTERPLPGAIERRATDRPWEVGAAAAGRRALHPGGGGERGICICKTDRDPQIPRAPAPPCMPNSPPSPASDSPALCSPSQPCYPTQLSPFPQSAPHPSQSFTPQPSPLSLTCTPGCPYSPLPPPPASPAWPPSQEKLGLNLIG